MSNWTAQEMEMARLMWSINGDFWPPPKGETGQEWSDDMLKHPDDVPVREQYLQAARTVLEALSES